MTTPFLNRLVGRKRPTTRRGVEIRPHEAEGPSGAMAAAILRAPE